MHMCWFVKDQSDTYSSLKNISVGVWPRMGVRVITGLRNLTVLLSVMSPTV